MNEPHNSWNQVVRETAGSFTYPPTPDIAAAVRRRLTSPPTRPAGRRISRLAWAVTALLLAMGLLLAVPRVRAAVWEFIRVGAMTIFVSAEEALGDPTLPAWETAVAEFAGLTTLQDARAAAGFPLYLPPAYGLPDQVYVQDVPEPGLDGQVVIMSWHDPANPQAVLLRLFQIDLPSYGLKPASVESIAQIDVNGQTAFWVAGGHRIRLHDNADQEFFFVDRNVLIWEERAITYRLESELSLAEAAQIAESLVPVEELE